VTASRNGASTREGYAVLRIPKVSDIAALVTALEKNPFGSLVLLLLALSIALIVWVAR